MPIWTKGLSRLDCRGGAAGASGVGVVAAGRGDRRQFGVLRRCRTQGGHVQLNRLARRDTERCGRVRRDLQRRTGRGRVAPEQRSDHELSGARVTHDHALWFAHVAVRHPDAAKRRPPVPQARVGERKDLWRLDIARDHLGRRPIAVARKPGRPTARGDAAKHQPGGNGPRRRWYAPSHGVALSFLLSRGARPSPAAARAQASAPRGGLKAAPARIGRFPRPGTMQRDANARLPNRARSSTTALTRRFGRVVDCTGLENRRA